MVSRDTWIPLIIFSFNFYAQLQTSFNTHQLILYIAHYININQNTAFRSLVSFAIYRSVEITFCKITYLMNILYQNCLHVFYPMGNIPYIHIITHNITYCMDIVQHTFHHHFSGIINNSSMFITSCNMI